MVVAKGQKVALVSGYGEHESVMGVGIVESQSKGGQITVKFSGMPSYRHNGTFRYAADGWAKGDAPMSIRPFRPEEDPDTIMAVISNQAKARQDAKRAEQDAKQAIRDADVETCVEWARNNVKVTEQLTVVGPLYIVEFILKADRKVTLVMRFGNVETMWGGESYRCEIFVSDQRSSERVDGGVTSATVCRVDAVQVAGEWIHSWAGVEWLTE
jgi:hypothetical protein